jgi:hypothetical protein
MVPLAHALVAATMTLAIGLVTGWPLLAGFIACSLYPIREMRQWFKGKGAGWAAALVPFAAAWVVAIVLWVIQRHGISFL